MKVYGYLIGLMVLLGVFGLQTSAQALDERCCNAPQSKWVKNPPKMPPTQCLAKVNHYPESHPRSGACKGSTTVVPPPGTPSNGGGNGNGNGGGDGSGGGGHGATKK